MSHAGPILFSCIVIVSYTYQFLLELKLQPSCFTEKTPHFFMYKKILYIEQGLH